MEAALRRKVHAAAEAPAKSSELVSAMHMLSDAVSFNRRDSRRGFRVSIQGRTLGLNEVLLSSLSGLRQELDAAEAEFVELSAASHAISSRLHDALTSTGALISDTARLHEQSSMALDYERLAASFADACLLAPGEEALLNQPTNSRLQLSPLIAALARVKQVAVRGATLHNAAHLATLGEQMQSQMEPHVERAYAALYHWATAEALRVDSEHPASYALLAECLAALSERPLLSRQAIHEICLSRRALHLRAFARVLDGNGGVWQDLVKPPLTAEGAMDGASALSEALAQLRIAVGAEQQMLRTLFNAEAPISSLEAGGALFIGSLPSTFCPSRPPFCSSRAGEAADGAATHFPAALEMCFEQLLPLLRRQAKQLLCTPRALGLSGALQLAGKLLFYAHALAPQFRFAPPAGIGNDAEAAVVAVACFGRLSQARPPLLGDRTLPREPHYTNPAVLTPKSSPIALTTDSLTDLPTDAPSPTPRLYWSSPTPPSMFSLRG